MKKVRSSDDDSVLEFVKKTYPKYTLCSYENLGRLIGKTIITNESRFYNERCQEILNTIHNINQTFHHYPDSYKDKMISSHEFDSLFFSQIFPHLKNKIKEWKNPKPEDTVMMIKLCSNFIHIGLTGMLQSMPSEFIHILEPKVRELFTMMNAINQYTKRIAPKYSKSTEFPFDVYSNYI